MKSKWIFLGLTIVAALASGGIMNATAQAPVGTAFTYQGQLKQSGALVNGNCDFNFGLWDSIGAQKGTTQTLTNIAMTNGLFNVQLNGSGQFGVLAFDGNARYLDIAVRCPAGVGVTTTLGPREQLTAAPYAQYAVNAASAVTANSVLTPTLRKYYLTTNIYSPTQSLTACAVGYHFASLWEIFNMASLQYNSSLGYSGVDQGSGPPEEYQGWVRTGINGNSLLANNPGNANCGAWTSNSATVTGTTVYLPSFWDQVVPNRSILPWVGLAPTCNTTKPVWCIQDLP